MGVALFGALSITQSFFTLVSDHLVEPYPFSICITFDGSNARLSFFKVALIQIGDDVHIKEMPYSQSWSSEMAFIRCENYPEASHVCEIQSIA